MIARTPVRVPLIFFAEAKAQQRVDFILIENTLAAARIDAGTEIEPARADASALPLVCGCAFRRVRRHLLHQHFFDQHGVDLRRRNREVHAPQQFEAQAISAR